MKKLLYGIFLAFLVLGISGCTEAQKSGIGEMPWDGKGSSGSSGGGDGPDEIPIEDCGVTGQFWIHDENSPYYGKNGSDLCVLSIPEGHNCNIGFGGIVEDGKFNADNTGLLDCAESLDIDFDHPDYPAGASYVVQYWCC